ncbi:MAG: T9SS type A sorting domain-containing protein [Fluviicola sp.]|nr:T9SS type A sorting domain-containing protein [Fluviicola sp.]
MRHLILILFCSFVFSNISFTQCANAGNDTVFEICKNTLFNLDSLLSDSAAVDGDWVSPFGNPVTNTTVLSSNFIGQYAYTYIVYDSICNTSDTAKALIKVIVGCTGSINEQSESFLQLSPNPVRTEIMITIPEGEVLQKVTVLNALGQEVYQLDKPKNKLDVSGLDTGIYTIKIEVKNKSYAKRFVKL